MKEIVLQAEKDGRLHAPPRRMERWINEMPRKRSLLELAVALSIHQGHQSGAPQALLERTDFNIGHRFSTDLPFYMQRRLAFQCNELPRLFPSLRGRHNSTVPHGS